ncbi:MAG: DNA primase [Oscillospiraceae bacterium]|nr:DNA primase [Oscillospiraceae bacterium]
MIPAQFIDELIARTDIADVVGDYVHLTPKGGNMWGLCPFHSEKTPSFSVNRDKQIYKCFGCGKGGGVINFIMAIENLSYPEAVRLLAKRQGMEVPTEGGESEDRRKKIKRAVEANTAAARFYRSYMTGPEGQSVREYMAQRKISPKFAARFGLGAAPGEWDVLTKTLAAQGFTKKELLDAGLVVGGKNGGVYDKFRSRLMLPVIDVRGEVVGFTSRLLPGLEGAKYLNSPDTICFKKGQLIYALNYAKSTKRPNLVLVEGNIDVITLHQAGFDNVIATMGTALTADHARIISRYTKELVLCYDNDEAGKKATDRALELLKDVDLTVRVLQLPNSFDEAGKPLKQDPDDFIKKFGPEAFERCLSGSAQQNDYKVEALMNRSDLSSEEGRRTFALAAVEVVGRMSSPIERELAGNKAAKAAGISESAFAQEVERWRKTQGWKSRKAQERKELTPTQSLQPKSRELRYTNLRSARAEEGVVRLVVMDPTLFKKMDLRQEEFSSPMLGKTYQLLRERYLQGLSVQLPPLAGQLTEEEMSHMIQVLSEPQSAGHAAEALRDYIGIIREEAHLRTAPKNDEALLELQRKLKEKTMEDRV